MAERLASLVAAAGLHRSQALQVDPTDRADWVAAVLDERERGEGRPSVRPAGECDIEVEAFVNYGRWVVQCPACRSAQVGNPEDPRFFCTGCSNEVVGHRWVAVVYPPVPVRREIERELLRRPIDAVMNWHPGESLDELRAENEIHGVKS